MAAEYNSSKQSLNASILKAKESIENTRSINHYESIEEETRKVAEREEIVYKMLSTVAILGVLFTVYRIRGN